MSAFCPRFPEAWLLMATTDFQRHQIDQRRALLVFLSELIDSSKLARERLVQIKAIDALVGLGRCATPAERGAVSRAATRFADWFAAYEVDLDICCHFLDSQVYLATHQGQELALSDDAALRLDRYFQAVTVALGASHPKVIAVMSRWQDVRARRLNAQDTAA